MGGALRILFFAQAREAAGRSEMAMAVDEPMSQEQFWIMLISISPALAVFRNSARLACNGTYLLPADPIEPNNEIAVIPPVSGG